MGETISIHYSRIRMFSILLLALPTFIFFLFWLRPLISIPASILLAVSIFLIRKSDDMVLKVRSSHLLILAVIILAWLLISGQGGFFTQTPDHLIRNAILKDMINYHWPVRYPGEGDESLVYYIGYWMVPSSVGKLFSHFGGFELGYIASRITLILWSFVFIYSSILMILVKLRKSNLKTVLIVAVVFMFFSGMDIVGNIGLDLTEYHIEKWAAVFSYSAMATQLIDAFNQAVPAWLATAIVINEKDERAYALIGLLLLSTSPLPLVGLALFLLFRAFININNAYMNDRLKPAIKSVVSPTNIISTIVLLPIYWIYYDNNIATESGVSMSVTNHFVTETSIVIIAVYLAFVLLEFGLLLLLVYDRRNVPEAIFIGVVLALIPFIHIGWSIDFCMRVSIPLLFVLMVMLMDYFVSADTNKPDRIKLIMTIVVFILGAFTGLVQYTLAARDFIESKGESAKQYDYISGFADLELSEKGNCVGTDSKNTTFFKYLAKN